MIPCSKCGCPDIKKYERIKLRDNGIRTKSIATYCILCHREEQKIREERRYEKKLAYNRKWCKSNREKKNISARKYYHKKKGNDNYSSVDLGSVEWHGKTDSFGFSSMTYTPLYVHGGR